MNLNKLLRLRSLAEVSAILQEMRYFGQFKDHLTTFRALIACDIHFCIWELSKFIFVGPPFGLFWSPKYLNFGGESCEIRILSRSIQETYTLGKVKNQVLLFLSSYKAKFVWSHGLLLPDFENGDKNMKTFLKHGQIQLLQRKFENFKKKTYQKTIAKRRRSYNFLVEFQIWNINYYHQSQPRKLTWKITEQLLNPNFSWEKIWNKSHQKLIAMLFASWEIWYITWMFCYLIHILSYT